MALSCDFVVRPPGFEPGTCGLRVRCSAVELEARANLAWIFRSGTLPDRHLAAPASTAGTKA